MSRNKSTEKPKPVISEGAKRFFYGLVQWGLLGGILLAAFTFTVQNIISDEIKDNSDTIKELFNERINGMNSRIDSINDRINDLNERIVGLEQDVRDIYKSSGLVFSKGLIPTDDFVSYANSFCLQVSKSPSSYNASVIICNSSFSYMLTIQLPSQRPLSDNCPKK